MRLWYCAVALSGLLVFSNVEAQPPPGLGTEEFGFSPRDLIRAIEQTEELISKCMRDQGFQYYAADHATVRAGMSADKKLPGITEQQFISQHGFGIATMYTGLPPQLATGYSPARVGLGERNVLYFQSLPSASQAAYNQALLGDNGAPTFAVALEQENLWLTGGCTQRDRASIQARATEINLLQSSRRAHQQRSAHEGRIGRLCSGNEEGWVRI
jgi:hypothetical protein